MSLNFKDKVSRTLAEVKVSKRVAGNPYNVSLGEVKLRSRLVRWLFYTLTVCIPCKVKIGKIVHGGYPMKRQGQSWWVFHS